MTVSQNQVRHLIDHTGFSMAQQDVRYYLNGMLLEITENSLRAVSTDGHRLATTVAEVDTNGPANHQFIVPRKGILELARLLIDRRL